MLNPLWRQSPASTALALVVAALFSYTPVTAQDAGQTSSGELKDFRLDNPAPKEKEPESAPIQDAPSAQVQEQKPAQPGPAQQSSVIKRNSAQKIPTRGGKPRRSIQPIQDDATQETAAPSPSLLPSPSALPKATTETVAAADPAVAEAKPAIDYRQYWPFLAMALAGLLGLALLLLWKRRGAAEDVSDEEPLAVAAQPEPKEDASPNAPLPQPKPQPVRQSATAPESLTAQFTPENARLSVANLTITGRLHLQYHGDAPLESLRLRTLMISACDGQKETINSFHSDPQMGQVNSLNAVSPGEEIKMKLELQLPRDALQAFDWRERRFVAPIVLIHIDNDKQAIAPVRITSLVGQEGEPGAIKLRPIPVDRGPKLFGALQFRPIAA